VFIRGFGLCAVVLTTTHTLLKKSDGSYLTK
jgi:hypothetical protein